MAENLKVTHYQNGDVIPNVTDDRQWRNLTTGAYCNYDNNEANVDTYGRLYNWYAVNDSRSVAPEGWHMPSDKEWKELEKYLGMSQEETDGMYFRGTIEGGKLKEVGTVYWNNPNTGATNESGFSALPSGYRDRIGNYGALGLWIYIWSSSESVDNNDAWSRKLKYSCSRLWRSNDNKRDGFAVRCVKN